MSLVHDYEYVFGRGLILAERDLPKDDLKLVRAFIDFCRADGISKSRCSRYLYMLRKIRPLLGKPFPGADRRDVERVVAALNEMDFKPSTLLFFRVTLKKFYRWLRGAEENPPEVAWLSSCVKENEEILPEDILTPEEVKRMVGAAHSLRDKGYVETGYEGGFRPSELLTLRIRDVEFDEYGAVITVRGKTGSRRVRVVEASPRLQTWIENHPEGGDPDAWLWINIGNTNRGKRLRYASARKMLRDVATRAKITKRVNPYSLRHARATHLAKVLTEAQMCVFFGWKQGSKMPRIYVHLSGRDVDPAILAHYGLVEKEELESPLKPRPCPRCQTLNSHDAKYCRRCSLVLDPREAIRIEEVKRKEKEKLLAESIRQEGRLNRLEEILEQLFEERREQSRRIAELEARLTEKVEVEIG